MIPLSKVIGYLICPRLCYFSLRDNRAVYTEKHAVKDIYVSLRMGFDVNWAADRARMSGCFDEAVFKKAVNSFIFPDFTETLPAKEWEVVVKSEKLGVVAVVDEIVSYRGEETPLIVSLKAPERGVWFADSIRAGILGLMMDCPYVLYYYSYSGELREVEVKFSTRRRGLKLVERVKRISKGFVPEKREGNRCESCAYAEDCLNVPETFASKFM